MSTRIIYPPLNHISMTVLCLSDCRKEVQYLNFPGPLKISYKFINFNVVHLFRCCLIFQCNHMYYPHPHPPWHEFNYSIVVEIRLLHSQSSTITATSSVLWNRRLSKCCSIGSNSSLGGPEISSSSIEIMLLCFCIVSFMYIYSFYAFV